MRVGNSVGVTVPSQFIRAVGVRVGDGVKVKTILETGQVIYTFQGVKQLSLNSLPKQ